ncbi:MAG: phospho-N-acetylmuramoyl-pentapeptide-transferase [Bacteroidales bacterium]|jgi:phospho-N-acetylmuramoyl-pentapeptide-transferase|nr:phospho-N-acetylmuramoyl-pentapeptide-transferase [Bacteroidales bacterium]
MLYYLFEYLQKLGVPGAGVFHYISFRAAMAIITSLIIGIVFGKKFITVLQKYQIGEEIRNLDLAGQMEKHGTPTMGGIIIIFSIIISTLLFAKLDNIYIILMLITTIWLSFIGFLDDFLKIKKKNKIGLNGKYKIVGQVILGIIVGLTLCFSPDVVIQQKTTPTTIVETVDNTAAKIQSNNTKTTIPFLKNNQVDYTYFIWFLGDKAQKYGWIVLVLAIIFIVTAVSNGSNLTDGLDGLNIGTAAIIGVTLGILAYVSGNKIAAEYLNIFYIPNSGELTIFIAAFIGAAISFLWFNCFPAQIFMGDTGSLAIGGIIAVFAILIKKELMLPILCGVYLAETCSVILQTRYFKYTKKKTGIGKRIFKMAPLHHHYQLKQMPESKIVVRFWIISLLLAVISIATLKLR